MTPAGGDPDEVVASRRADVELLRVYEDAEAKGLKRRTEALRSLARGAVFRQRTALGVEVRRREQ